MSTHHSPKPHCNPKQDLTVPRDTQTAGAPESEQSEMPPPDGVTMRDEDYAEQDRPLLPDSVEAKKLHAEPPRGKDQLQVGSAGDAARPSKPGMHNKPIPPRGRM